MNEIVYIPNQNETVIAFVKRVRSMFNLGSPSNIVRLRDALIERDIIYSEMRQLYLTDPVFGLWFKKRFL